jgi:PHD/YefM family antitoxin component YafN of YafNO toxin-antitoxin module
LKAEFENKNLALFPNQFVPVRLHVDTLHQAILIPRAAIQEGALMSYVYVVKPSDNTVVRREVQVTYGPVDGGLDAVTKGLDAGEVVVTAGLDKLHPGMKVTYVTQSATHPAATQPTSPNLDAVGLENAAQHLKFVEEQVRAGVATELDLVRAARDLQILQAQQSGDPHAELQTRVAGAKEVLRIVEMQYRAGIVSRLEYERAKWDLKILEAQQSGDAHEVAQARLERAKAILELIQAMVQVAILPDSELQNAQAEVKLRQAELEALGPTTRPTTTQPAQPLHAVAH